MSSSIHRFLSCLTTRFNCVGYIGSNVKGIARDESEKGVNVNLHDVF
jgi:ATP-dependent protease HslVU (ClpYQ) ATPase subunit